MNASSVDIVVKCNFTLYSELSNLKVVHSYNDITTNGNELCLNVIGGNLHDTTFVPNRDAMFNIGTTPVEYLIALNAANYEYITTDTSITYEMTPNSESFAYFSIDGMLSPNGNWSELTLGKNIMINCVYSFTGVQNFNDAVITNNFILSGADSIEYLDK